MLYLTDNPITCAAFLPRGKAWQRAELSESDLVRWQVFGEGREPWACDVPVHGGAPFPNRRVLLIDCAASSQFDAAMAALKGGCDLPNGLVCLALEGSRHRGQRNRPWTALRGNLHLTVHYRVMASAPEVETGLTMLPAVAAASAIGEASNGRAKPRIKWVNDILLDGRKVSGVLTSTHVQGQTVERAVFGIGINVARAPAIEPTPFVPAAGALSDYGVSLVGLFANVMAELDSGMDRLCRDGSGALFGKYRDLADFIGRTVSIWPEDCSDWRTAPPLLGGQVLALNDDLSLDIEGHSGAIRKGRMAYA